MSKVINSVLGLVFIGVLTGCDDVPEVAEDGEVFLEGVINWRVIDNCGYGLEVAFYEVKDGAVTDLGWPAMGSFYLQKERERVYGLSCEPGSAIAYGAAAETNSGRLAWGMGVGNVESCRECAVQCPSGEISTGVIVSC